MRLKKLKISLISAGSVLLAAILAFFVWAQFFYYRPSTDALSALVTNDKVAVKQEGGIEFIPLEGSGKTGFIFYPGGKVDEKAYSYIGSMLAFKGFPVFIVKMPLRLAVFNPNAASKIIESNQQIENWVIGGHSLGGSMAALFAYNNSTDIDGIIFLASYPSGSNNFSNYDVEILSIAGTSDGIINSKNLEDAKLLLPKSAEFIEIQGANHSQFGDYGFQSGDNSSQIDKNIQHELVIKNILNFLEEIEKNNF